MILNIELFNEHKIIEDLSHETHSWNFHVKTLIHTHASENDQFIKPAEIMPYFVDHVNNICHILADKQNVV